MGKASNEEEDSDSDELHVDLEFFECENDIEECGDWKRRKKEWVRET
jgi:hypothetical protein